VARNPSLVLVFHGARGDGPQARRAFAYEFDRLAEAHGFLVAYPDGFERNWNDCRRAIDSDEAHNQDVDDLGFVARLIDHLSQTDGVDPARVFATGVSNGGHMTLRLALETPDRFRAFAPVVASLPAASNMKCEPSATPVPILMLNGTEDPLNPFEGGAMSFAGGLIDRGEVLGSEEMLAYFGELAGHQGEPRRERLPDLDPNDGSHIERVGWEAQGGTLVDEARASTPVWLYTVVGGGHNVPHPKYRLPRILGNTNRDLVGAELLWAFFSEAAGSSIESSTAHPSPDAEEASSMSGQ
jgi:polyhydroxybutyrate depolymerase